MTDRGGDGDGTLLVGRDGLDRLIAVLRSRGYRTMGPTVRDGAIVPGEVDSTADLPGGWSDEQEPGAYRLRQQGDELFRWAVGPSSWKAQFFPPRETLWRARPSGDGMAMSEERRQEEPVAVVGARPCDLAGLAILDRVLAGGVADPSYQARRRAAFVIVAECGHPSDVCFCSSMGTGPAAGPGADIVLTELADEDGVRYLVRPASSAGRSVVEEAADGGAAVETGAPALERAAARREAMIAEAEASMSRRIDAGSTPSLLARNLGHPRWDDVASRCLACGNCTLVCPTCFCSAVEDVSDLSGTVERRRRWDSCFEAGHSYIHGGTVRASTAARYRQWLTHKLSTWHDQFGTSGCVGCGRCITWCPVGIDLTEEVAAIAATDGARQGP